MKLYESINIIMNNTILAVFALIAINSYSQPVVNSPYEQYFGDGKFVIKGKVENKPEEMKSWSMAVCDYISNEGVTIPVAADGSFEEEINIKDVQDIYLYLGGDAITIFSYPGDTIEVYFDNNNQKESLKLKGRNDDREKELALCLQIFNKYRQTLLDIRRLMYNSQIEDEEFLSKLNEYYDNKIETIKAFEKENGEFTFLKKFRDDAYFQTVMITVMKKELLPKIHCEYPDGFRRMMRADGMDSIPNMPYSMLSIERFKSSPSYRDFLNAYVSSSKLSFLPSNSPVKSDYYMALSCLNIDIIRDWYITKKLDMAFTYYDFNEASFVFDEFKKICDNKDYINLLDSKYQVALRTQPGNPAPDFELKDETGKTVKLSDLRGKFVYIDFWGIGCGPCIHEFQNSVAQFHEKYKDYDIAYVYINVSDNETNWKKGIEMYNLKGINLTAEGWTKHPTCLAYNVMGIPHYTLIDKEGKIIDNKCDRPSIVLMKGEGSVFDKAVKGK